MQLWVEGARKCDCVCVMCGVSGVQSRGGAGQCVTCY
jgi:hypothetical protein